jgi:predicted GTPase
MRLRHLKLKAAVLVILSLAPVVFLVGVGMYHLYDRGWSFTAYWPMAACWLAAYVLGWYWTRRAKKAPTEGEPLPGYWTDRDKAAWELVEAHAAQVKELTPDEFGDLNRYSADAQDLALQIARVYKPTASDPFGHLTLPEILACGELVSHDLTKLVDRYIPGSHIMSVNDYRRARDLVDSATVWYPRLRNAWWIASAFFNPIKTGMQVAAVKAGLAPAFEGFQQNLMLWFHTMYLKELGRYLIELNSGRLRVGAKRYLELMAQHRAPPVDGAPPLQHEPATTATAEPPAEESLAAPPVTLAVVGPVKAGKSSLVNALLGEQKAGTDVLPLTAGITRYTLKQPGLPTFSLLDTQGFGHEGAKESDVRAAVAAAAEADAMLLVVPARSAARRPEVEFLDRIRAGVTATPNLKMPPVFLVLSHIDLLSPAAEWNPPYDWLQGDRPKEQQIREAMAAAEELFVGKVEEVIPVCTAPGKEMGVRDDVLAAVAARLGEARGVSLLRALHAEATAGRARKVIGQVVAAGGQLFKVWLESRKK